MSGAHDPGELYPWVGLHRSEHESSAERVVAFCGSRKARSNGCGSRAGHSRPTLHRSSFMRWPTISAISCGRWQRPSRSRIGCRRVWRKAHQDRRDVVRSIDAMSSSRWRRVAIQRQMFQEILRLIANRAASVRRSIVTRSRATDSRSMSECQIKSAAQSPGHPRCRWPSASSHPSCRQAGNCQYSRRNGGHWGNSRLIGGNEE